MVTFILVIWSFLDYYYLKEIQLKQHLLGFLGRTISLIVAENILHKRIMSIFLNFPFLLGHLAKVRSWKIFSTCSSVEKVCVCVLWIAAELRRARPENMPQFWLFLSLQVRSSFSDTQDAETSGGEGGTGCYKVWVCQQRRGYFGTMSTLKGYSSEVFYCYGSICYFPKLTGVWLLMLSILGTPLPLTSPGMLPVTVHIRTCVCAHNTLHWCWAQQLKDLKILGVTKAFPHLGLKCTCPRKTRSVSRLFG